MSWDAVMYVYDLQGLSAPEKALMFALAVHLSPANGDAWPSLSRLAIASGLDKRTVRRILTRLRDRGLIVWTTRHDQAGDLTSSCYRLPLLGEGTAPPPGGVTPLPGGARPLQVGAQDPHGGGATPLRVGAPRPPKGKGETTSKGKRETTGEGTVANATPAAPPPPEFQAFHEQFQGRPGYCPTAAYWSTLAKYADQDLLEVAVCITSWVDQDPAKRQATTGRILNWLRKDQREARDAITRHGGSEHRNGAGAPATAAADGEPFDWDYYGT